MFVTFIKSKKKREQKQKEKKEKACELARSEEEKQGSKFLLPNQFVTSCYYPNSNLNPRKKKVLKNSDPPFTVLEVLEVVDHLEP